MNEVTLEQRVEWLERHDRRLKLGMLVVLAVVGALLFVGMQAPQKVVEAEKFVLRDGGGRHRAVLETLDWGPSFTLYGANGKKSVELATDGLESGLIFYDDRQKQRVRLVVEEGPMLDLCDAKGRTRAWLFTCEHGPALAFADAKGDYRAVMAVTEPSVLADMFDGKIDVQKTPGEKEEPGIILFDAQGDAVYRAPAQ